MDASDLKRIYERQVTWFAGERSRLLRKVDIATKQHVLDLGAGTGETLSELIRRSDGFVCGLDANPEVLRLAAGPRVMGQAQSLPFADDVFDLVFTQMFFIWAGPLPGVLAEIRRVLAPSGHLLACAEPDYGGAIAHPHDAASLADLAESLMAEGADVRVGRKLGAEMKRAGFKVTCGVHPSRPIEAAQEGSPFHAPELLDTNPDLEFLYVPYFHFLAVKT